MECQKIINLLDNTTNYPSIFRIRNWVEINDESKARYRISNIRFRDGPTLNANGEVNDFPDNSNISPSF